MKVNRESSGVMAVTLFPEDHLFLSKWGVCHAPNGLNADARVWVKIAKAGNAGRTALMSYDLDVVFSVPAEYDGETIEFPRSRLVTYKGRYDFLLEEHFGASGGVVLNTLKAEDQHEVADPETA